MNPSPLDAAPGRSFAQNESLADTEQELATRFVLSRIFAYLKPVLVSLAMVAILTVSIRGLQLAVPLLVAQIVDTTVDQNGESSPHAAAFTLVGVFITASIFQFISVILYVWVAQKVVLAIRTDVLSHLLSLSIDFFARRRLGELMSRAATDTIVIQEIGTSLPLEILRATITVVGGLVLVLTFNTRLTLILLAFLPAVALITLVFGGIIRRLSTQVQDKLALANVVVEESLAGVHTVKSFGREAHEASRYRTDLGNVLRAAMRRALAQAGMQSTVTLMLYGSMAVVLWYATTMIQSGELTPGDLIAFMLYALIMGNSCNLLTSSWSQWQRLLGAGRRVFELFLESPSVVDRPHALDFDGSHKTIQFRNVCFAYPRDPKRYVLSDLSFTVERGQVIALVGESGAGKSTVVSLLLRLYEATGGTILIDDTDIRDLKQSDLRNAIAVVPQDIVVFGRTLRENIAYGKLDATDSEVISAARAAHALEFAQRMPDGLDTLVGARGVTLSGGERQRIAIARAILKHPSILILDEATSALDNPSETRVRDALARLMAGRTTFVIAHSLSTIENADRVLVLHDGRLVESGTHAELLVRGGHFARLYELGTWQGGHSPESIT